MPAADDGDARAPRPRSRPAEDSGAGEQTSGSRPAAQRMIADEQSLADMREQTACTRLDAAAKRDAVARARDLAALARDQAADARDLAVAQLDDATEQPHGMAVLTDAAVSVRAAKQRKRAAGYRAQAAHHHALAAADRRAAARDREEATHERLRALADREALATEPEGTAVDVLTGARTRAAGLAELAYELDRTRRNSGMLVAACVEIVGLQDLDDTEGHGAGDELLKGVVALITAHLRSYDLIIRIDGDELLCAMSGVTLADARERFSQVAAALPAIPDARGIRTGFAQLAPHDSAAELIARADSELVDRRAPTPRDARPPRSRMALEA